MVIFCFEANSAEEQFAPPKYNIVDEFGVNLVSLEPQTHIETTAIGGERGLSHSVATSTAGVLAKPYSTNGFEDKYGGLARNKLFDQNENGYPKYVMRVFDHQGSMDFEYLLNPTQVHPGTGALSSNYGYLPVGDLRHYLFVAGNNNEYLDWVKPDGTVTRFYRGSGAVSNTGGRFLETTYPNGFKITNHKASGRHVTSSITTNTGYQLKYEYDVDNRTIATSKNVYRTGVTDQAATFANQNPARVVAINSAVEFCDRLSGSFEIGNRAHCAYSNDWPTASFQWPAGMPKVLHVGSNQVSVSDSKGRTSTYYIDGMATAKEDGNGDFYYAPRLRKFKSADATAPDVEYSYRHIWTEERFFGIQAINYISQWHVLEYAYSRAGTNLYQRLESNTSYLTSHKSSKIAPVPVTDFDSKFVSFYNSAYDYDTYQTLNYESIIPGKLEYARIGDRKLFFESSARNVPLKEESAFFTSDRPKTKYVYRDNYSNVEGTVVIPSANSGETATLNAVAHYYREDNAGYACPQSQRKYCNKPRWIQDARGNITYYTYHPESGEVATVTSPANEQALVAQTRYTYKQYYANYYHADGTKKSSLDPIWLLSSESFCANSAASGDGCSAGDEVITTYEYNHDNLHLTAVIVTAKNALGAPETQRTCFQYDKYGNQVGEISPLANLSSCPN